MHTTGFRLIIALSIIAAVVIVSAIVFNAMYHARPLSTAIIKIYPQENNTTPTISTISTRISISEQRSVLAEIDDWAITITLYGNGTGVLRLEYVGEKPLVIENPLLPLTAGLNIALEYNDPSRNIVLRSLGTYYYNSSVTIEHGNYSQVKFDSRGLKSIKIEGKILGQIPVRVHIPLTVTNCGETNNNNR